MVLDGERLSYRNSTWSQIGSVYETIMGFRLETATVPFGWPSSRRRGWCAPNTVDLDGCWRGRVSARGGFGRVDPRSRPVVKGLRAAERVDDLHAALDRVLDKDATPDLVPSGALVLQPNEERRRSGSHYTPRELTEPIVRHTLAPIFDRLRGKDGRTPAPARILDII